MKSRHQLSVTFSLGMFLCRRAFLILFLALFFQKVQFREKIESNSFRINDQKVRQLKNELIDLCKIVKIPLVHHHSWS